MELTLSPAGHNELEGRNPRRDQRSGSLIRNMNWTLDGRPATIQSPYDIDDQNRRAKMHDRHKESWKRHIDAPPNPLHAFWEQNPQHKRTLTAGQKITFDADFNNNSAARKELNAKAVKLYENEKDLNGAYDLGLQGPSRTALRALCNDVVVQASETARRKSSSYFTAGSDDLAVDDPSKGEDTITHLKQLQRERTIIARMGFTEKAHRLDEQIQILHREAEKAKKKEENALFNEHVVILRKKHHRRIQKLESQLALEVSELVETQARDVEKTKNRQRNDFVRVLENAERRAMGRLKKCNCNAWYLCRHNKTASYNTRKSRPEVIIFRRNSQRLKRGGRAEDALLWEEKANELDLQHQEEWRKFVARGIVSSPWGANEAMIDQLVENHKRELRVLRETQQVARQVLEEKHKRRRYTLKNCIKAEHSRLKLQVKKLFLKEFERKIRIDDTLERAKQSTFEVLDIGSDTDEGMTKEYFEDAPPPQHDLYLKMNKRFTKLIKESQLAENSSNESLNEYNTGRQYPAADLVEDKRRPVQHQNQDESGMHAMNVGDNSGIPPLADDHPYNLNNREDVFGATLTTTTSNTVGGDYDESYYYYTYDEEEFEEEDEYGATDSSKHVLNPKRIAKIDTMLKHEDTSTMEDLSPTAAARRKVRFAEKLVTIIDEVELTASQNAPLQTPTAPMAPRNFSKETSPLVKHRRGTAFIFEDPDKTEANEQHTQNRLAERRGTAYVFEDPDAAATAAEENQDTDTQAHKRLLERRGTGFNFDNKINPAKGDDYVPKFQPGSVKDEDYIETDRKLEQQGGMMNSYMMQEGGFAYNEQ